MSPGSTIQGLRERESANCGVLAAQLYLFMALAFLPVGAVGQAQSGATPASPPNGNTVSQSSTSQSSTPPVAGENKDLPEITTHQETDTTFKVNVNLVVVRVVVRDGQGHAVGTLKKEDFQLFDDGKPQTIARFAVEKTENRLPAVTPGGPGQTPGKLEAPERYVAYFFDDLHLPFSEVTT